MNGGMVSHKYRLSSLICCQLICETGCYGLMDNHCPIVNCFGKFLAKVQTLEWTLKTDRNCLP